MWRTSLVVVALLAVSLPAQAQVNSCGEGFELFIRNPDVGAGTDGKFHVSGDFFVQFQVIGPRADEIDAFAFSVGLPVTNPEEICTLPIWPAGLMLEAYKADLDKDDGFFILMNTKGQSTPQGIDLSVAVHGYDEDGTELARFWATAVVESCPGPGPGGCSGNSINDDTMPWMIILPGDGKKDYVDGQGFTVEFAEALSEFRVFLNAEDITDQMEDWDGRQWDADTYYDYGPAGIFHETTPMCSQPAPIHTCVRSPGPAYKWTQRPISDDDVIRVEAVDVFGNLARKEIHVGSSVAGGTIADGLPILTMTFDTTQQLVRPGGTAVFRARMENTGGGQGHPLVSAQTYDNWTYEWTPGHKPVDPATQEIQELNVVVPLGTPAGIYPLKAIMKYQQGQQERTLQTELEILVDGSPAPQNETADSQSGQGKESPAPLVVLLPLLVAWFVRRRR